MYFTRTDGTTNRIGLATSLDGWNWTKAPGNPELREGGAGSWDDAGVGGAAILADGTDTFLYYHGTDGSFLRIGRARVAAGYAASGWFESAVLDTGMAGSVWRTLSSNATVNLVSTV